MSQCFCPLGSSPCKFYKNAFAPIIILPFNCTCDRKSQPYSLLCICIHLKQVIISPCSQFLCQYWLALDRDSEILLKAQTVRLDLKELYTKVNLIRFQEKHMNSE